MNIYDVIEKELGEFSEFFSKPQLLHFKDYICGILSTTERKTIVNINDNSGNSRDQSQLNRFVTNPKWNVENLKQKYNSYAIGRVLNKSGEYVFLIFDDTVKPVSVKNKIEGVERYFDHVEKRFIYGHKFFTSCVTNGFGLTEPFEFEMYRRRAEARRKGVPYRKITNTAKETIEKFAEFDTGNKRKVAIFDIYYAAKRILKTCQKSMVSFVTKVKSNKKFVFGKRELHAKEFDKWLPFYREIKIKGEVYEYSEPIEVEWEDVGKVYLTRSKLKGANGVQYYITDLHLSGGAILKMYSNRWEIETMHRDLKQVFGFGDYMVRNASAIKTHLLISSITYAIMSSIRYQIIEPYTKMLDNRIISKVKKFFTLGKLCKFFRKGIWGEVIITLTGVKFMLVKKRKTLVKL